MPRLPTEGENRMTDEHLQKKHNDLEDENLRSYQELYELTQIPMNTVDARLQLFIEHMQDWGIIDQDQRLEFEMAFQLKVKDALDKTWEQVRKVQDYDKQTKAAKKLGVNPNPPKIIIPGRGQVR